MVQIEETWEQTRYYPLDLQFKYVNLPAGKDTAERPMSMLINMLGRPGYFFQNKKVLRRIKEEYEYLLDGYEAYIKKLRTKLADRRMSSDTNASECNELQSQISRGRNQLTKLKNLDAVV